MGTQRRGVAHDGAMDTISQITAQLDHLQRTRPELYTSPAATAPRWKQLYTRKVGDTPIRGSAAHPNPEEPHILVVVTGERAERSPSTQRPLITSVFVLALTAWNSMCAPQRITTSSFAMMCCSRTRPMWIRAPNSRIENTRSLQDATTGSRARWTGSSARTSRWPRSSSYGASRR